MHTSKAYRHYAFQLDPVETRESWIDSEWDRSSFGSISKFAGFYMSSIPNYVTFTWDRCRHVTTGAKTPYNDLRMLKNFALFIVRVTKRCHYENASMAFLACFVLHPCQVGIYPAVYKRLCRDGSGKRSQTNKDS